jgi:hypothetical protein
LFVADNAGDAILLHVSASSEGQELGKETGIIRKRHKTAALKIQGYLGIILPHSFVL